MLLDIKEPGQVEEQAEQELIIGIDFGTTNSLVALSDGNICDIIRVDGKNHLKSELVINGVVIPSIKRCFGKNLKDIIEGDFYSQAIKNIFTETNDGKLSLSINRKNYFPVEIASKIFVALKKAAESYAGKEVHKAVVSVPAYFDDATKSMVRQSAKLAGLEVVRLLAEPTAAAYYYGLDNDIEGNYIVYDLGGGTFDVSILKMTMGAFQVVATAGDSLLGGDDIDLLVENYIKKRDRINIENSKQNEFIKTVRFLKENLANHSQYSARFEKSDITLSREELVEISSDLISKTLKILKKTIFESKLDKFEGIILVGGSTKLYGLKSKLSDSFPGIKILDNKDPDEIVVLGAAKQAYNLSARTGDLLVDVVPLSLGIELYGGLTEKLIYRNTSIPAYATKKYTTYVDNQTGMDIHIVQGDRELASDCRSLSRVKISGIPPMIAGKAQIEITFKVDTDGLLSVEATELTSAIKTSIDIKPTYALDEETIYHMLKNAFENSEEDFINSKKINLKIELESSIYTLRNLVAKNHELLSMQEKENLENLMDIFLEDLNTKDQNSMQDMLEKLGSETSFFVERIMNLGLEKHIKGQEINKIIRGENG
jgi:molecular chaperone HscA